MYSFKSFLFGGTALKLCVRFQPDLVPEPIAHWRRVSRTAAAGEIVVGG